MHEKNYYYVVGILLFRLQKLKKKLYQKYILGILDTDKKTVFNVNIIQSLIKAENTIYDDNEAQIM